MHLYQSFRCRMAIFTVLVAIVGGGFFASTASYASQGRVWHEKEGDWEGTWIRRGNTDVFDATWILGAGKITAVSTITVNGSEVRIARRQSTDGDNGDYTGQLSADGRSDSGKVIFPNEGITNTWTAWIDVDVAQPPLPPSGNAIHYRVENFVFNAPDIYQNPRNYHDFMVDFTACTVRELNQPSEQGIEQIRILVCRDRSRLMFITSTPDKGSTVEYDWVFRDDGKTISGAYRQGSLFGPSVGGIIQEPQGNVPPNVAPVGISGSWSGTFKNTRGESGPETLDIKEESNGVLTGLWDGSQIVNGRRSGDAVTWETHVQDRDYKVSGTISSDGKRMTLKYSVIDPSRGNYSGVVELATGGGAGSPAVLPANGPPTSSFGISGSWSGTYTNTRGESGTETLDIKEESNGVLEGLWGGAQIVNGRRSGDALTWEAHVQDRDYKVSGTISSDGKRMTLKYSVIDPSRGNYSGVEELARR